MAGRMGTLKEHLGGSSSGDGSGSGDVGAGADSTSELTWHDLLNVLHGTAVALCALRGGSDAWRCSTLGRWCPDRLQRVALSGTRCRLDGGRFAGGDGTRCLRPRAKRLDSRLCSRRERMGISSSAS